MNTPQRKPTSEKLAEALSLAGAPQDMIARAEAGYYDDYKSPLATPIMALVIHARAAGLHTIAEQAKDGEFDAQDWESDEWAQSPEGQETFAEFFKLAGQHKKEKKKS
jgi:hypothetical protein